jgi:hypothetical protein
MDAVIYLSVGVAQAKREMIQELFLAMQGDPRGFKSLRDVSVSLYLSSTGCNGGLASHEKRGEIGLLK